MKEAPLTEAGLSDPNGRFFRLAPPAPAQIAFNPSGATSFSVVFAAAGTQTVSIADLERPQIRGSVSVEVKARQDGGGCGSAGNTDLSSLLPFALAACWRLSRPSPGLPRMRSNGSLLC